MSIWLAGRSRSVFSSPTVTRQETARIAGLGDRDVVRDELREYDDGHYDGLTTAEIWQVQPAWELFRDGVSGRRDAGRDVGWVDALLAEISSHDGDVLLFGHGHCFRSVGARFLGLSIQAATGLRLDAGTLSILSDGRRPRSCCGTARPAARRDHRGHRHGDRPGHARAAAVRLP